MAGALGPPVAILFFGWTGAVGILLFLLTYVVLGALWERRGIHLPIIAGVIQGTRRPDERFPVAPLEFLAIILLLGVLFHEDLFFPAVAVLAIGDGSAALVGLSIGRHRLPGNPRKTWEGLAAGVVAGVAAGAVFATLGRAFHEVGYERAPLLHGPRILTTVAFLLAAYGLLFVTLEVLERRGPGHRAANASPARVLMAVATATLMAAAFLAVAPGRVEQPLLTDEFRYSNAPAALPYVLVAAALAMIVEGWLRRHDNLVLPLVFVEVNILLLWLDPLGVG